MLRQFPWCESRPDGRRAIRNHQDAHARGIRNARKVVDTSVPKFFKLRAARGGLETPLNHSTAGGVEAKARMAAGILSRGWDSPAGFPDTQSLPPPCEEMMHPARKQKRPFSAPLAGHPRVKSDKGVPIPTQASPTRSVVLTGHEDRARPCPEAETVHRMEESFASNSRRTPRGQGGGGGGGDGADRGGGVDEVHLSAEQQAAFRSFVALLAGCPAEAANGLARGALQESQELRLLSNFG